MSNSASKEMEEQMIKKMKEACGYEFTNKLSRMFTDIGLSEELTKAFHEVNRVIGSFSLSVALGIII